MSYAPVYVARYSKSKKESGSVKANQVFFFFFTLLLNCPRIKRVPLSLTHRRSHSVATLILTSPTGYSLIEDVLDQVAQLETESSGFSTTSTHTEPLLSVQ